MRPKRQQDNGKRNPHPHPYPRPLHLAHRPEQCGLLGGALRLALRHHIRLQQYRWINKLLHPHIIEEPSRELINNKQVSQNSFRFGLEQEQFID